jgi:hypothetical protein
MALLKGVPYVQRNNTVIDQHFRLQLDRASMVTSVARDLLQLLVHSNVPLITTAKLVKNSNVPQEPIIRILEQLMKQNASSALLVGSVPITVLAWSLVPLAISAEEASQLIRKPLCVKQDITVQRVVLLQFHAHLANISHRPDKKVVFQPNQGYTSPYRDKLQVQLAGIIVLVREPVVQLKEFVLLVNTGFPQQGNVALVQQGFTVGRKLSPL